MSCTLNPPFAACCRYGVCTSEPAQDPTRAMAELAEEPAAPRCLLCRSWRRRVRGVVLGCRPDRSDEDEVVHAWFMAHWPDAGTAQDPVCPGFDRGAGGEPLRGQDNTSARGARRESEYHHNDLARPRRARPAAPGGGGAAPEGGGDGVGGGRAG